MFTPGTLSSFRRTDLIRALERAPQQARPAAMGRMSKDDLFFAALRLGRELPDFAALLVEMADRQENPNEYRAAASARAAARLAQ